MSCFDNQVANGPLTRWNSAVGAGDTFIAGMLYGLICRNTKWDIQRCLRFAVNLATLKVQREGFRGLGNDTTTMRTEEEAP